MKKIIVLAVVIMALTCLAACGSAKCKECDREAYKDGYCEYHYALNVADEAVNDLADGLADDLLGSIFG